MNPSCYSPPSVYANVKPACSYSITSTPYTTSPEAALTAPSLGRARIRTTIGRQNAAYNATMATMAAPLVLSSLRIESPMDTVQSDVPPFSRMFVRGGCIPRRQHWPPHKQQTRHDDPE